jgi:hypothetical protein
LEATFMMLRSRVFLAAPLMLLVLAGPLDAQIHVGQVLPDAAPGSKFSLTGDNLPGKRLEASLGREGTSHTILPVAIDASKVTFAVPDALAPGAYLLRVKVNDDAPQFVGQLTVVSAAKPVPTNPTIQRTYPIAGWIKLWRHGLFDFAIIGERLPAKAAELTAADKSVMLFFGDERLAVKPCVTPAEGSKPLNKTTQTEPCYSMRNTERLDIHGLPARTHGGPHLLAIETPKGKSNAVSVRISRITPRMIKWLSLAFLAVLVASVGLLAKDAGAVPGGGTPRKRLLGWVLLDQQTNTYSLSKLQLLLWMVTIVYCFVFLQLAFVFAQGKLQIAPLPEGFEWLLGITGGTALVSGMLTRSRGAKGAGDAGPALADLVSSGGMLAADRAQLLVWTLIGCCGYVLVVLRNPTEAIDKLPMLNLDLLNAMGISSLVYVGGKSVRLPGPVVNQVTADIAQKTLTVKGQNLHRNAMISLDRQPIEVASVTTTPMPGAPVDALSAELVLTLTAMPFTTDDHLLRVTNLDGQYAEDWFPADTPAVTGAVVVAGKADEVPAGKSPISINLTGTGFRTGSAAEWMAPGQSQPALIAATEVAVTSPQAAKVTFTPGEVTGTGTIALVSVHGTRAARQVTVK